MAFDNTSPADLLALKTEEADDPTTMRYAAVDGQTRKTLELFNDGDKNVGGETIGEDFTSDIVLDVIDPDEVTVGAKFSEGQANWLNYLMAAAGSVRNFSAFEAKFRLLFADYTPSSTTLDALNLKTRALSRAEVLFGEGTTISKADWIAARNS